MDADARPRIHCGLPAYTGLISNVGVLLWCAGAISLFAGALLRHCRGADGVSSFLIVGGLLTLMLMGDDFFTVHEGVAFYLNVSDSLIVVLYAMMTGIYMYNFRNVIIDTDFVLLGIALIFLGTSAVVDFLNFKDSELLFALVGDRYHLVEDGPKFVGVAAWLGYFTRVSWVSLRSEVLASSQ